MPHTSFDQLPEPLKVIRTRPLFVMKLAVQGPLVIGAVAGTFRRIGIVTGGTFTGERLSGRVTDGGSDWQVVREDGATTLDVRLSLETRDGALIAMTYTGLRHGPEDVIRRMERGEAVDPASYYFRISPRFETASPAYTWLNQLIAIGTGHREAGGPMYSVFEVL